MKNFFAILSLATVLISCGVKVPYTTQIRDEFSLDSDEKMRQVQFYTSHTIILNQEKKLSEFNMRFSLFLMITGVLLFLIIKPWKKSITSD